MDVWKECGGKLGFADSFLHGRLGSLLLKLLSEHANGRSAKLDEELVHSLTAMVDQLKIGEARLVRAGAKQKWFVYTDASYEPETLTGGLGGVLLDSAGKLVSWFGLALASDMCKSLGGNFDLRVGASGCSAFASLVVQK